MPKEKTTKTTGRPDSVYLAMGGTIGLNGRPIMPADKAFPKRKATMELVAREKLAGAAKNQRENPPENETPPAPPADDVIGLTPDPPAVKEPSIEIEEDTYFCQNCKHTPLTKGDAVCPICETELVWEGI